MSAPAVFRAEDAEALAEGWPHVRALRTSGSKKPAAARAARVLTKVDPVNVVWTREVALAFLRGHGLGFRTPKQAQLEAIDADSPLDERGFVAILEGWTRRDRYGFHYEHLVLLGEALLGPDACVRAICTWLEGLSRKRRAAKTSPRLLFVRALTEPLVVAYWVGFPLGRAEDPAPLRARLEAFRSGCPEGSSLAGLLGLVLAGAETVERLGLDVLAVCHFVDDPAVVRRCSAASRRYASLSPRFIWLGGAPVLDDFAERARAGLPSWYQSRAVEELGVFAEPEVLPVMAALAERKRMQKAAHRWFADHAGFARRHWDRLVDAPTADALRAVVDRADAG